MEPDMAIDFTKQWDLADVSFIVEDKKIYANKSTLMMWSPVLNTMFTGNFVERDANEVKLPGKKFRSILKLMEVLHPPMHDIDSGNVFELLLLAREYQILPLTKRCESFLNDLAPSVESLYLAEEFGFKALQLKCMNYIKQKTVRELEKNEHFKKLKPETIYTIYSAKCRTLEVVLEDIKSILNGTGVRKSVIECNDETEMCQRSHRACSRRDCRQCSVNMTAKIQNVLKSAFITS